MTRIFRGDAARLPLPDRAVNLTIGSPPYCDARTYGINAQKNCFEWVDWMLAVTAEAVRVTDGPVIWIAAGVTRRRNYWPACEGLMWEWFKRSNRSGVFQDGIELPGEAGSMYRPCYWYRFGIPGSGGDQWFRADVEYAMCFKRPGKLPWSNNTAMGHPPKWAPGGAMSHRLSDGARVNQWGGRATSGSQRTLNGDRQPPGRPSHRIHTKRPANVPFARQGYTPPVLANPGNLISVKVGGGQMGSKLAHENEAPFPEGLVEFFVASLCPPGGICFDPFSGSGTTAAVAIKAGRRAVAGDMRQSQCILTRRRTSGVQMVLPGVFA